MCTVVVVVTESKNIMSKTDRAESKLALGTVAPAGTGYEQAVTNQPLVRDCIIEYMVVTIQALIF